MNVLVFVCSVFLLSVCWHKCHGTFARGKKSVGYTYLLTEDVRLEKFGNLPLERQGRCRNVFVTGRYSGGFVRVGRWTGNLVLTKSIRGLRKDTHGIRRVTIKILVLNRCFWRRGPYRVSSRIRFRKMKSLNLIIFPVNFGDRFLKRYSPGRISSKVHESNTFRDTSGSSSLLRILRVVSQKLEREAFDQMMSSIKVEKTLEFVINEILTKYVPKCAVARKQVYYGWFINSLFSTSALQRLARECGCQHSKVIKCPTNAKYRTIDGTCNNIQNPSFGSAPEALNRLLPAKYFDVEGFSDPVGYPGQANVPDIPATFKVVREFIIQQNHPSTNKNHHSHALMQFGQFLDHDLDLSPESQSSDNCQNVKCDGSVRDNAAPCYTIQPLDKFKCIHFARSATECQIKYGRITTRQQINVNTAFIDASQVYGSTQMLAKNLRDWTSNKGFMKTAPGVNGEFLPPDSRPKMSSFCAKSGGCFIAGDTRSNEQVVLATMHTLFLREHNRIARALGKLNPHWNGEKTYQETRKIVGAVLQKITYEDFLPIIIGDTLPQYHGYNSKINPGILNSFSTAAFRFGHSLIRPTFDRLDAHYNPTGDPLPLRHLFSNNTFMRKHGIDELVLGLLGNSSETVDRKLAVGVLNHLYERPHSPGLNLAALNIQRGRDHGLPGYNAFRRYCGLKNAKTFRNTVREIRNRRNRRLLAKLYKNKPDLADLWVAGLAETPANGGLVGATFGCIIREQMKRARDGDKFFYTKENVFSHQQLHEIKKATLSKIICDNLKNIVSIQKNAFLTGSSRYRRVECGQIPGIDLTLWRDSGSTKY